MNQVIIDPKHSFSGPVRNEGESMLVYQARRALEAKELKRHLRGTVAEPGRKINRRKIRELLKKKLIKKVSQNGKA